MATVKNTTIDSNLSINVPFGTTQNRPAATDGNVRFNTDLNIYEYYNGDAWIQFTPKSYFLYAQERRNGYRVYETSTQGFFNTADQIYTTSFGGGSQDSGITLNNDGTKLYTVGGGQGDPTVVRQFSLSTPYDIRTRGSEEESFTITTQSDSTYGSGTTFVNQGTQVYISFGESIPDRHDLYTCSTPYDLRTRSFVQTYTSSSNAAQGTGPLEFNRDGTRAYHGARGGSTNDFFQYELNAPFDFGSVSSTVAIPKIGGLRDVLGLRFEPNGFYFYTANHSPDNLFRWRCTTAFDLTTATFDGNIIAAGAFNGCFVSNPPYY